MSKRHFLDFEHPIAELESKIDELRYVQSESAVDISEEIDRLSKKSQQLAKDIYSSLTPWQVTQIARHPQRPYTLDYVNELFTDFQELHGDRSFADDQSIVGGLARFNGQACMVIGHQKGRDTRERAARNFGMPRPEGYRKALRLMRLAEKFGLPVFTFVDTPGAYPGIGAEERGQSEAIGHNLFEMSQLKVPTIATIIGEGGSGGALAIGVGLWGINIPVGWVGTALPVDAAGAAMFGDGSQKLCTLLPKSSVELFGLRVGRECYPLINTPNFNDLTGWLLKLVGLLISGVADMFSVVIRQSLVQLETPDEMRGRVGAVNSVFIGASNQLGEFESGATAAVLGPVGSVLLGGVGTLVIVALWFKLFPELAQRDRLQPG